MPRRRDCPSTLLNKRSRSPAVFLLSCSSPLHTHDSPILSIKRIPHPVKYSAPSLASLARPHPLFSSPPDSRAEPIFPRFHLLAGTRSFLSSLSTTLSPPPPPPPPRGTGVGLVGVLPSCLSTLLKQLLPSLSSHPWLLSLVCLSPFRRRGGRREGGRGGGKGRRDGVPPRLPARYIKKKP